MIDRNSEASAALKLRKETSRRALECLSQNFKTGIVWCLCCSNRNSEDHTIMFKCQMSFLFSKGKRADQPSLRAGMTVGNNPKDRQERSSVCNLFD